MNDTLARMALEVGDRRRGAEILLGNLDAAAQLYAPAVLAARLDHGSHESGHGQAKLCSPPWARPTSRRRRSVQRSRPCRDSQDDSGILRVKRFHHC
jgi:hypothetical protein